MCLTYGDVEDYEVSFGIMRTKQNRKGHSLILMRHSEIDRSILRNGLLPA